MTNENQQHYLEIQSVAGMINIMETEIHTLQQQIRSLGGTPHEIDFVIPEGPASV